MRSRANQRTRREPRELPTEGTVTTLRPDAQGRDRVRVSVDDVLVGWVTHEGLLELGIGKGTAWDRELAERFAARSDRDAAYQRALNMLGAAASSRARLSSKLRGRGHSVEAAEHACARLATAGLLDDEAFARRWVAGQLSGKPVGRRRLHAGLRQRGVEAGLCDRVLNEALEDVDSCQAARRCAEARARSKPPPDPSDREALSGWRRRMAGYLARRGFDADACREAVRAVERSA